MISLLLCAVLCMSGIPSASAEELPVIAAESAVVMNTEGRVLYGKNENERLPMASTTKLMTALLVAETCDLGESVEIDASCCGLEGSSMYLCAGERLTLRELLYGLLLVSGNDAAAALAVETAGSEEAFVARMNEKAAALGMRNTHYANPHGLDAPEHYSTAEDLGLLMAACMQNRELMQIAGTRSKTVGEQTLYNHNKLLARCPGCLGGKTGYTDSAGRCLVSGCKRGDTLLVCVTLNDPGDWDDHCALYDWAFARFCTRNVSEELRFAVPVISGERAIVEVLPEPLQLFLPREVEITAAAELPRFVFAPVSEGETAGVVRFLLDGEILGETRLTYAESIGAKEKLPFWRQHS